MFLDARALKTLQKQVFWTDVIAENVKITVCLTGNITKTLSKAMFWKDLLPLLQKTRKLPSVWLETLEKRCQKKCFGRISYIYIYMLELATGIGTWKN